MHDKDNEIDDAEYSSIKIKKYNTVSNSYEEAAEITFGNRRDSNAILQENKLFVLGGRYYDTDTNSKCVSRIRHLLELEDRHLWGV